jgi:copper transport protein
VLFLSALLLVGAPADVASAHAQLISISPADGTRLSESPSEVVLTFNEAVGLGESGVSILRSDGSRVDEAAEKLDGGRITQALPELAGGWYVVTYHVVSEDGHVIRGASTFAVGDADAGLVEAERMRRTTLGSASSDSARGSLLRALANVLVLVSIGAVLSPTLFYTSRIRVANVLFALAAVLNLAAWANILFSEGLNSWHAPPALQYALRALFMALVLVVYSTKAAPHPNKLTLLPAAATLATYGLSGHGYTHGSPVLNAALLLAHLTAAAVWLGSAPLMYAHLRTAPLEASLRSIRRFSTVASVALPSVVLAGGALTAVYAHGLPSGRYGYIVLVKTLLVGMMALLGLYARRELASTVSPKRMRRVFTVETVAVVVLASVSALLTSVSPRPLVDHTQHHEAVRSSTVCTALLGSREVELSLDPGATGENAVHVYSGSGSSGEVKVSLRHANVPPPGLVTELRLLGENHWTGSVVLPFTGQWQVEIVEQVDRFTLNKGRCELVLQ